MKKTKTAREWFDTYVDKGKLRASLVKAVEEAIANDSREHEGTYIGLVHEIVGGNNGRYIPFYALEYFDYEDIDTDNIEKYSLEYVLDELDGFTYNLEQVINAEVAYKMGMMVNFGHWEADGTYCMMVTGAVEPFERNKHRYKVAIN